MSLLALLKQQAEDARTLSARRDLAVELGEALGEDGLAELVAALNGTQPNRNGTRNGNGTSAKASSEQPRGRDAVRIIVRERPGLWTLAQIQAALKDRGWFTSAKAAEAAAKRLCDINGEGRRIGPGRYVFPPDHEEAAERTPADSAGVLSLTA
jgi:hypothetical protein